MAIKKQFRILSIDGGGIRGLVPALILSEIEARTGKKIAEMFDFIAGTSTGGILSLGLSIPDENNTPKYSASDLAELYEKRGEEIFSMSTWKKIASAGGVLDEKYSQKGIESVLKQYFGETTIKDALVDVLVTSYDIEKRKPFFFKSLKAKANDDFDFPMWKAARSTSAAPTYFEPYKLETDTGYKALVDGGVFANNPTMCAYADAIALGYEDLLVVSIGTGETNYPFKYNKAKNWGMVEWIKPVIGIMMDGNSDTVTYQIEQVLKGNPANDYFRIQTQLTEETEEMDNASEDNMERLKALADDLITKESMKIGAICDKLMDNNPEIA